VRLPRLGSRLLGRGAALAAVASALGLAACLRPVPADPGLNAELRARPALAASPSRPLSAVPSPDDDPGARTLYLDRCSRCHEPFPPGHATPAQWPTYVRKYGPRAGLFGEDRERVLRWLQAQSR
jgi:hypothetical protein